MGTPFFIFGAERRAVVTNDGQFWNIALTTCAEIRSWANTRWLFSIKFKGDPIIDTLITLRPGNRLPHAWLMKGTLPGKRVSTIDLVGHCAFTLLTGHGGNAWKLAGENASKILGDPMNCYSIGWGLDYHDLYRDWYKKREIEELGMLLVRPDRYVAWRSTKLIPNAEEKVLHVFRHILSINQTAVRGVN